MSNTDTTQTARRRCGECPKEFGVGSQQSIKGLSPNMNSPACDQFRDQKVVFAAHGYGPIKLVHSRRTA